MNTLLTRRPPIASIDSSEHDVILLLLFSILDHLTSCSSKCELAWCLHARWRANRLRHMSCPCRSNAPPSICSGLSQCTNSATSAHGRVAAWSVLLPVKIPPPANKDVQSSRVALCCAVPCCPFVCALVSVCAVATVPLVGPRSCCSALLCARAGAVAAPLQRCEDAISVHASQRPRAVFACSAL